MSIRTSFIYGYGFYCDCDDNQLIAFITNHKESFCKTEEEKRLCLHLMAHAEKECDLKDFYCNTTGLTEKGAIIATIMSRETGIQFRYYTPDDDCNTPAAIVFTEKYPWQLNQIERTLTEETLSAICAKYINELNISEKPDHLELKYFG